MRNVSMKMRKSVGIGVGVCAKYFVLGVECLVFGVCLLRVIMNQWFILPKQNTKNETRITL